jgi:hypothetical protein
MRLGIGFLLCCFLLDGAESGATGGAAAPPAAAPSGVPAAPPAAGVPAASPAAPAIDPTTIQQTPAQLRAAYEQAKASLQPWEKLGAKPDEVAQVWQSHTQAVNQANEAAAKLGYTPQQVADAVKELGIVKVAAWLEQEAAKAGPPDPLKALEDKFNKALEPIRSERQQAQLQATYQKFETATNAAVVEKLGGAQFAKDYPELAKDVFDYASALMAADPAVVADVKKGDLKSITKFVDQAYTRLTGSYQKFGELMQKRAVPEPAGKPAGAKPAVKRISLDDIINGRDNAVNAIPSMRSAGSN